MTRQQPIEIQEASTAADGLGGQTVGWTTTMLWWADVRNVRGREQELHGRLTALETYLMVGRYDPRITTEHRVVYGGRPMNIRSAQDRDGMRQTLTIEAEVGVNT